MSPLPLLLLPLLLQPVLVLRAVTSSSCVLGSWGGGGLLLLPLIAAPPFGKHIQHHGCRHDVLCHIHVGCRAW